MKKSLLVRALEFAAKAHQKQKRDNGVPYIVHPASVVGLLAHYGERDERVLAAGVLHDVVEDCGVPNAEVTRLFGKRVGEIVREVSVNPSGQFSLKTREGFMVKLCDKFSNLNEILSCSYQKQERYVKKTKSLLLEWHDEMAKAAPVLYSDVWNKVIYLENYLAGY